MFAIQLVLGIACNLNHKLYYLGIVIELDIVLITIQYVIQFDLKYYPMQKIFAIQLLLGIACNLNHNLCYLGKSMLNELRKDLFLLLNFKL